MGDRCNIVMEYEALAAGEQKLRIFFYGHDSGSEAPMLLQRALARRCRWDDPAYLSRIIFCKFVRGCEDGETGFGISPYLCDNQYPLLVVDTAAKEVRFEAEKDGKVLKRYSFDAYCALKAPKYPRCTG